MAAKSVLGVSEVRPPLLDDLPHTTRSRPGGTSATAQAADSITSRRHAMNAQPDVDDEDDDDVDEEDDEEEETWQVVPS